MDIPKALKRIMPLRRLARDQAGTPEGDTALKQAKFFEEKYNLKIPDDAFEATSHKFEIGYLWEEILLEVLSGMFELAHHRKDDLIVLNGPKFALDEAIETFEFHRDTIERLAVSSAISYIGAAIPGFTDALGAQIEKSAERKEAREKAGIKEGAESGGDDEGRYTSGSIIDRVFSAESNSSQQKLVDLMRSIGLRNARPFWKKYQR